jgi:hypothetical protein
MTKLQDIDFAYLAINRVAIWALLCFSALLVDLFTNLRSLEVIYARYSQLFQKSSSFLLRKQHLRAVLYVLLSSVQKRHEQSTYFADVLQDVHSQLQVSNVKGGKSQPDMTEVPIAALKSLTAGSAEASLARDSLEEIQVSANIFLSIACPR